MAYFLALGSLAAFWQAGPEIASAELMVSVSLP
jgi:hypothetical protein